MYVLNSMKILKKHPETSHTIFIVKSYRTYCLDIKIDDQKSMWVWLN